MKTKTRGHVRRPITVEQSKKTPVVVDPTRKRSRGKTLPAAGLVLGGAVAASSSPVQDGVVDFIDDVANHGGDWVATVGTRIIESTPLRNRLNDPNSIVSAVHRLFNPSMSQAEAEEAARRGDPLPERTPEQITAAANSLISSEDEVDAGFFTVAWNFLNQAAYSWMSERLLDAPHPSVIAEDLEAETCFLGLPVAKIKHVPNGYDSWLTPVNLQNPCDRARWREALRQYKLVRQSINLSVDELLSLATIMSYALSPEGEAIINALEEDYSGR